MTTLVTPPIVPYVLVESLIQNGDLLLCAGTSPMSKMIQEGTDSPWSHVGLLWKADTLARTLVLESVESVGISPVSLAYYAHNYRYSGSGYPGRVCIARDTRFQTLTPPEVLRFVQTAVDLFRRDYDNAMIALIAWRLMCEKLGLPVAPRQDNDAYICSEYVMACYDSVGWDLPTRSRGFVAPRDFAEGPMTRWLCELEISHALTTTGA